jgi:hypothetical protein
MILPLALTALVALVLVLTVGSGSAGLSRWQVTIDYRVGEDGELVAIPVRQAALRPMRKAPHAPGNRGQVEASGVPSATSGWKSPPRRR